MNTCLKCNQTFPNKLIIDGKERNLQNRKYCINCSVYGGKNTRQLHKTNLPGGQTQPVELICSECDRTYIYHHADSKGHTKTKCNSCLVNKRRIDLKIKCLEYKGNKCEQCGYDKCSRAMSFHHKDATKKDFGISGKHCYTWQRIKSELDKCSLLCANCHMEEHERLEAIK